MLSTWSWQNSDMTSRESTPMSRSTRDISLANDTLVAWNALQAYLTDSATRASTTRTGWSRKPNSLVTVSATRGSEVPTMARGEAKKSATPEPSRRNSGHIAAPAASPVPARPPVRAGATTSSIVPGGTVLRMTTLWCPDAGGVTAPQRGHDVVDRPADVGQVGGATGRRWRPDAHQGHVGPVQSLRGGRPGVQRAARHRLRDQRIQPRLGHRAAAGPDLAGLGRVDVDSPYVMAVGGQAGCRHRPHVAETEHRYLHYASD